MTLRWLALFADVPVQQFDAARAFWTAVTGTVDQAPHGEDGEFVPLVPRDCDPTLWLQRVHRADGAGGWHPDLLVDDLDHAVATATAGGALVHACRPGVVTCSSPAGGPFCLVEFEGEHRAPPVNGWPDGHLSLAEQVCLDVPASVFDAEVAFWSDLTGWPQQPASDGFARLSRPEDLPLRVLLQRLGPDDDGPSRAHLDFSCDDVAAESRRHEALGASVVQVTEHWTVLRDPVGLVYCVTAHPPGP